MRSKILFFAWIVLFLTGVYSFSYVRHPYYVSVTEVRIDPAKKMVSLSCKMFTDDFQEALSKVFKTAVDLEKRKAATDSLINVYVKDRAEVRIGSGKLEFKFIGYEFEEESTWCYFEAPLLSEARVVDIKSSLLYDFIETQTNFVHCYYEQVKKSFKLDNPNKTVAFDFNVK